MDLFKDIIKSILNGKNKLDVSNESCYNKFVVDKALSYHLDCIPFIQEINPYIHNISNQMHYDYLFYSIRKMNRGYKPWIKTSKIENIEIIKEYYNVSDKKANEILGLLNEEQLKYIKQICDKEEVIR